MNDTAVKRRRLFIDKRFQGRFILGAFAIIMLSGLCSALLIYWITGDDLKAQTFSAHINIADADSRLGLSILIGNVVSILVAGGVAIISVLYASHKIAGPLYRFKKLCEEVGNGNLDTITSLREQDLLQELALAFSVMLNNLRDQRDRRKQHLAEIQSRIDDLKNGDNLTAQQRETLKALAEAVETLHSLDSLN
jgi:nitrogen fixation/metabolism regulation signal transduction histidine kinase